MAVRRRIEVQIGELVLENVAPRDRRRVAAAFRSELARRVLGTGLPAGLGALSGRDVVDSRPLVLGNRVGPEAVGRAVAGGVWRTLEGGAR